MINHIMCVEIVKFFSISAILTKYLILQTRYTVTIYSVVVLWFLSELVLTIFKEKKQF